MCIGTAEDVFIFNGAGFQRHHSQPSGVALKQGS
jgi:hypothetical protein